jgi:hypothetical protein
MACPVFDEARAQPRGKSKGLATGAPFLAVFARRGKGPHLLATNPFARANSGRADVAPVHDFTSSA